MSAPLAALHLRVLRRRLARPLRTAHGVLRRRDGLLVVVEDVDGAVGLGEAAPLPSFDGGSLAGARAALEAAQAEAKGRDPGALLEAVPALETQAAARFALHAALADLGARRAGLPLAAFLARAPHGVRTRVEVHALLAAEDPAPAAEAARRAVAAGFRALKLKGGSADPVRDVARVAAVRDAVGPEVGIRLDVNGTWSEARARAAAEALAPFRLAWLEQPVAAGDVDALARLRREGAVPVAADEALLEPEGGRRVLEQGAADVLVLKPAALGGLDRALALAREAAAAGVATTVTTLLDGVVAARASLHLAAALPGPPRACGIGTGPPLHGDVAPALRPVAGHLPVPEDPGLGPDLEAPSARGASEPLREGAAP